MDRQDYDDEIDIPPYAVRRPPTRGFDPEMRRIALIAGGFAGAIVLVALIWGGVHPRLGPPPVIKPPPGPMRTAPANPGGLQVPGANEQIMSGTTASGPPRLAPPPPQPDFSKLAAEANSAQPKPKLAPKMPTAAAVQTQPPGAGPVTTLPPPPVLPPSAAALASGASASASASAAPAAPATTPATAAAAAPNPQVGKAMPTIIPPTQAASAGPHDIQLGALVSMAKANEAWQILLARVPDLLAGRTPVVVPGTVNGQTFYRLRLGGFASAAAAAAFCDRLKTRHVACYVPPK
ncbi:SPOR domain-containing protein [Acidiphilium cryptum]|uniref:Sporulation domain protein n=2 Tax=Acidiphilium TaxID=522 RepID=A5FX36_ACICJ|nr:SPOR domain-containing protein [Acidiphilium cryptum]ABQ30168.1 Sporulation domain protein [Acidiphilium cryptum JF-5]